MAGFQKAKREQIWVKGLLTGPSGCGKSYSAQRLAKGMAEELDSRVAMIGTEGSRDKYYANEFDYDLIQLEEPFSISSYEEAIDMAIDEGYKILIIDSLSHEWKWLNDQHDKMPGNSFQNWGKLKPKHSRFMDKVLNATIHIIATARGKDEWVMEDKNGKQVPKKVGLGAVQDKEVTYNYTVSFILEQDTHIANADKDNTHLFEDRYEPLTEKDGKRLIAWANSSDIPATVKVMPKINEEKNEELTVFIKEKFTKADADTKTAVKELMAEYGIKNFKEETVYDNSTEGLEKIAELLKSKEESK